MRQLICSVMIMELKCLSEEQDLLGGGQRSVDRCKT